MRKISHKRNICTAIILTLTFCSLIMLSSCNKTNNNENAVIPTNSSTTTTTSDTITSDNSNEKSPTADDSVPAEIINDDVNDCLDIIDKNSDFTAIDSDIYDIDSDGSDEVLVLADVPFRAICVFKKENGKMVQTDTIGMGALGDVESLKLYTYSNDGEEYPYFIFHFDNGGVMKCDVLAAIKRVNDSYDIEYLLSFGTLNYTDIPEPFTKEFYRIGWNKTDVAMDGDYNDISKEEFLKLYEKYKEVENID